MAQIYHRDLTGDNIHEPKDITIASAGQVYVADGQGSGEWDNITLFDPGLIEVPVGVVIPYCGTSAPRGWAFCYAQALSRSTYSDLFNVIGTAYGVGDGSTTFNVPDCRGRSVATVDGDADRLTSFDADSLGEGGGTSTHTLTANQMPVLSGTTNSTGAHTHTVNNGTNVMRRTTTSVAAPRDRGAFTLTTASAGGHEHTASITGGGQAHNNLQPTLVTNMIIYHGVF